MAISSEGQLPFQWLQVGVHLPGNTVGDAHAELEVFLAGLTLSSHGALIPVGLPATIVF
jgi:hypothetical protein